MNRMPKQDPIAELFEHFKFMHQVARCQPKERAGSFLYCEKMMGWCEVCKNYRSNGIDFTDPHQFFVMSEDEPENHKYEMDELADMAQHLGAQVVGV